MSSWAGRRSGRITDGREYEASEIRWHPRSAGWGIAQELTLLMVSRPGFPLVVDVVDVGGVVHIEPNSSPLDPLPDRIVVPKRP